MLPVKRPSTYLEAKPAKRRRSESLSPSDDETSDEDSLSQPGPSRKAGDSVSDPSVSFLRIAKELDIDEEDVDDEDEDEDENSTALPTQVQSTSRLGMKPKTASTQHVQPVKDPSTEASGRIPPSRRPHVSDFAALGVSAPLVSSLSAMSIRRPTPVQAACIPELLAGKSFCHL